MCPVAVCSWVLLFLPMQLTICISTRPPHSEEVTQAMGSKSTPPGPFGRSLLCTGWPTFGLRSGVGGPTQIPSLSLFFGGSDASSAVFFGGQRIELTTHALSGLGRWTTAHLTEIPLCVVNALPHTSRLTELRLAPGLRRARCCLSPIVFSLRGFWDSFAPAELGFAACVAYHIAGV
jgi:hypothetical protein